MHSAFVIGADGRLACGGLLLVGRLGTYFSVQWTGCLGSVLLLAVSNEMFGYAGAGFVSRGVLMQHRWGYCGARASWWQCRVVPCFGIVLLFKLMWEWFLCDKFVELVELRLTGSAVISVDAGGFMVISMHVCVLSCLRCAEIHAAGHADRITGVVSGWGTKSAVAPQVVAYHTAWVDNQQRNINSTWGVLGEACDVLLAGSPALLHPRTHAYIRIAICAVASRHHRCKEQSLSTYVHGNVVQAGMSCCSILLLCCALTISSRQ